MSLKVVFAEHLNCLGSPARAPTREQAAGCKNRGPPRRGVAQPGQERRCSPFAPHAAVWLSARTVLPGGLRHVDRNGAKSIAVPRKRRSSCSTVAVFQQHGSARLSSVVLFIFSLECYNFLCTMRLSCGTPQFSNVLFLCVYDVCDKYSFSYLVAFFGGGRIDIREQLEY